MKRIAITYLRRDANQQEEEMIILFEDEQEDEEIQLSRRQQARKSGLRIMKWGIGLLTAVCASYAAAHLYAMGLYF